MTRERTRVPDARSVGVRLILGVALLGALLVPSAAPAALKTVGVRDKVFSPDAIKVAVGDTVNWVNPGSQAGHNVREDGMMFFSGDPVPSMDYSVIFSAGTFHYFCEIHGTKRRGMDGVIRVPVTISANPTGVPFTVTWASTATETGSRFDVQYRVGSGAWTRWKGGTRSLEAVFGSGASPVAVDRGTKYSFRARSARGSQSTSFWSPVVAFTP